MAAQVIPLLSRIRAPVSRDWSQREIAEFYRVESALVQAGLELESERGMSDEGDPWFCFCRADTGEVFIHFARVDGRYVVDGGPFGAAARGDDFSELVRELIARHPLAASRRSGSNVFMHPAALLIALVGACFFHSGQAKAAETAEAHAARLADAHRRQGLTLGTGQAPPAGAEAAIALAVTLDAAQTAAILTGVLIGLRDAAPATAAAREAAAAADPTASLFVAPRVAEVDPSHLAGAIAAPDSRAVLAVVAVLHDLFRLQAVTTRPAAAPTAAAVSVAASALSMAPSSDAPAAGAPSAVPAVAPAPAERPVVVVHLTAAALPHVEAVALLEATGVLKLIGDEHLESLDRLPAYLADAIAHGEHVQVVAAPADVTDDGTFVAPDLTAPLSPGHAIAADAATHDATAAGPPPGTAPTHTASDPAVAAAAHDGLATPGTGAPAQTTDNARAAATPSPGPTGPDTVQASPQGTAGDATAPSLPVADPQPAPATVALTPAAQGQPMGSAGSASGQGAATPATPPVSTGGSTSHAADPTPPVAQPPATQSPSAPTSAVTTANPGDVVMHGHSAALDAAVLKFTAAVHAGMLVSGSEVVLYDPQILKPLPLGQNLDSITFHFDDGSSISLVGTTSSLHDLHGVT